MVSDKSIKPPSQTLEPIHCYKWVRSFLLAIILVFAVQNFYTSVRTLALYDEENNLLGTQNAAKHAPVLALDAARRMKRRKALLARASNRNRAATEPQSQRDITASSGNDPRDPDPSQQNDTSTDRLSPFDPNGPWGPELDAAIARDTERNPLCVGKEPLLAILYRSQADFCNTARRRVATKMDLMVSRRRRPANLRPGGRRDEQRGGDGGSVVMDEDEDGLLPPVCTPHVLCNELPHWTRDVGRLYGTDPVIVGLDTCERYRSSLRAVAPSNNNNNRNKGPVRMLVPIRTKAPAKPLVRVAGLYNSGTNALSSTISNNVILPTRPRDSDSLDVPWGKHIPLSYKWTNTWRAQESKIRKEHVLPIVIVRDPYRWLNSMCKESYDVEWKQHAKVCPHLLDPVTRKPILANVPNPAQGRINKLTYSYNSVAEMWSSWNNEYVEDTTSPRLLVRFEDLIFHTEQVVSSIATCAGLSEKDTFQYLTKPSKQHGDPSDFVGALIKAGSAQGRYGGLTSHDFVYTKTAFNETLMDLFHYQYGPGPQ